jgi:acetyl esterase/lipase
MRRAKLSIAWLAAAMTATWLGLPVTRNSVAAGQETVSGSVTRPVISEDVSPVETINPLASDGHRGLGLLRKPPGNGPFPAAVVIHGGLVTLPRPRLDTVGAAPMSSRLLAAGYVVAVITYRSRDRDPQSDAPIADTVAAVEHVRKLPYVDAKSVVIYGCSGGGDLALQAAAVTDVAAIAPEEPASVLFTGVLNNSVPKRGETHTPADAAPLMKDPLRYYTADFQKITRAKIARIDEPILIVQGDEQNLENRFNAQVLIPELKAAGKKLELATYPGEPHCFAFVPEARRPAAALKAFEAVDAFFRRHVATQPKPVDAVHIKEIPLGVPVPIVITAVGNSTTAFAGRWHTSFLTSGGITAQLKADGSTLSGSFDFEEGAAVAQGRAGSAAIYDGRIDGNTVSFKVKSPDGERTITFTGTLKGDEIAFTREVEVRPGGFPGGQGIFGAAGPRTFAARKVN